MVREGNCVSELLSPAFEKWQYPIFRNIVDSALCNCSEIKFLNNISALVCAPYPFSHPLWVQTMYIGIFSFIIFMAIGGNFTVIWIVLTHKRMRTVTNYFLLNLAIADASITIFNTSFTFTYNLYYNWFFGYEFCTLSNVMGIAPTYASVFTLMSMSLDRYMAIVHPLRTRLSKRKTIGAIAFIWFFAFLCASPNACSFTVSYVFFWQGQFTRMTACNPEISNHPDLFQWYNHFLFGTSYFLPLVVLTVTYTRVAIHLWGSQSIGEHRNLESIRTKKKVIKMMIVVVGIFLVCWLPYHVYFSFLAKGLLAERFSPIQTLHIYLNMYWLAMSSTIMNPVIYCWMNKRFRTGFKYAYRWLPCIHITREEYATSDLVRDNRRISLAVNLRFSAARPSEVIDMNKTPHNNPRSVNGLELKGARSAVQNDEISSNSRTIY